MTPGGSAGGVPLPSGAPRELVDFADGRASAVSLDGESLGWIDPDLRIEPLAGSTASSLRLGVTWGPPALPAPEVLVVIVDGRLSVDPTQLPVSMQGRLVEWVAAVNRALAEQHRELVSFALVGSAVEVTARPRTVGVMPASSPPPIPPPPPPGGGAPPPPPPMAWPAPVPKPLGEPRRVRRALRTSTLIVFLLAIGGVALSGRPNDDDTTSSSSTTALPPSTSDTVPDSVPDTTGPDSSDDDPVEATTGTTAVPTTVTPTTPPEGTTPGTVTTPPGDGPGSSVFIVGCGDGGGYPPGPPTCTSVLVAVGPPALGLPGPPAAGLPPTGGVDGPGGPPGGSIPSTGSDTDPIVVLAAAAIAAGFLLVVAARRRGDEPADWPPPTPPAASPGPLRSS